MCTDEKEKYPEHWSNSESTERGVHYDSIEDCMAKIKPFLVTVEIIMTTIRVGFGLWFIFVIKWWHDELKNSSE